MRKQTKSSFLFIISAIFITLLLYFISYNFFISNFKELENEQNRKNLHTLIDLIDIKFTNLSSTVNDYAHWDDTYDFIKTKDKEYIYQNFREGTNTLEGLDLDFMIFITIENEMIFSTYNENYKNENKNLFEKDLIDKFANQDNVITVYKFENQYFYLLKKSVSNSDETLEPNGYIYIGKLITNKTLNDMGKVFYKIKINDHTTNNYNLFINSKYYKNIDVKVSEEESCNCLKNELEIKDKNQLVLPLVTLSKREIIEKGKETIFYYNILITIFLFFVFYLIYKKQTLLEEYNFTLEKRVEEEVEKSKKQQQLLVQQAKLASMGEMIGNIAHQWRQPLNSLGLLFQSIEIKYKMKKLNEENLHEIVNRSRELTKNMSETINDFMYFFNPKNENETFSLKEVIDTSLNLFNSRELKCKIEVNTQADMENKILGTKNGLVQVLLNLLSNASDSIENCDTNAQIEYLIKINVKNDSKNIIIEVEDNGKGIDEKIINRIFEPYFTTKFKSHGTGIGLYMSKVIIEEHMKGSLTVKNGSKGAIFTILLPMVS